MDQQVALSCCCTSILLSNRRILRILHLLNHTKHDKQKSKGPVIRVTFLFNLSRNIVAFQVERVVARITTACSTCLATNLCCKLQQHVAQSRTEFYF